jgi:hypothetical protein
MNFFESHNYFLASPYDRGITLNFVSTDSEKAFRENFKKYGTDWIWANKEITYKFNSLGYRMKEFSEIDYSNYIAFFGCSNTAGIGLPLEYTFAYKISKKLNVDCVNSAIGGSPVDFQVYNFVQLMNSSVAKPKAVLFNWPDICRTFYWTNNDTIEFCLPSCKTAREWKSSYIEFLSHNDHMLNRFKYMRDTVKVLCKGYGIKLFELTTSQSITEFYKLYPDIFQPNACPCIEGRNTENNLEVLNICRARDLVFTDSRDDLRYVGHPGIFFNDSIVDKFVNWYNNE